MFADVVNEHYEDGDVVWCHDYHLMFLPQCLKDHNSNMKVGWFLHTPFPSSEIHRTLPSRSELLRSVLAADLVGYISRSHIQFFPLISTIYDWNGPIDCYKSISLLIALTLLCNGFFMAKLEA